MDILEQAKKEDLAKRISEFSAGIKELTKKLNLEIRPQISPDGPIISIIDIRNENNTFESQPVDPIKEGGEN